MLISPLNMCTQKDAQIAQHNLVLMHNKEPQCCTCADRAGIDDAGFGGGG